MSCGIYIHVPFCTEKCHYCSFYSVPIGKNREPVKPFVNRLFCEIRNFFRTSGHVDADTVYFGGGTPSILEPDEIASIINLLRGECNLDDAAEISLEVNPVHVETKRLESYRDCGINRIILGVQTFDSDSHDYIGRQGNLFTKSCLEKFISVKGIVHCADIICGIPGEKKENLARDLTFLVEIGIKHISCYALTVEHDTPLGRRFKSHENFDDLQADSLMLVRKTLQELGYHHYEISNYAMPGYESRHNMKYWRFEPYIAFGPSAHGFFNGERWQNPPTLKSYMKGDERIFDSRQENDFIVEYYLAAFRRLDGIPMGEFAEIFGHPVPDLIRKRIMEQIDSGFLSLVGIDDKETVCLTEKGILNADGVIYQVVRDYIR